MIEMKGDVSLELELIKDHKLGLYAGATFVLKANRKLAVETCMNLPQLFAFQKSLNNLCKTVEQYNLDIHNAPLSDLYFALMEEYGEHRDDIAYYMRIGEPQSEAFADFLETDHGQRALSIMRALRERGGS